MDASVLVVYVEPLLVDRRVLYVGPAASDALTRLSSQAREVLALDTARGARPSRLPNGRVVPLSSAALRGEDDVFDVVLVHDLDALGLPLDEAIDDMARLLSRRGKLVLGVGEGSDVDHELLWDELSVRFDCVRLAGVAPVRASAVAELGDDVQRDVVVDGSLVRTPPAMEGFVAVASQADFDLDGYLLVQLDDDGRRDLAEDVARLERAVAEAEAELEGAAETVAGLRTERDAEREGRRKAEREAREAREAQKRAERELRTLDEAVRSAPSPEELDAMEERLAVQAERVLELEAEVERRGRLVRELVEDARRGAVGIAAADPVVLDEALERAAKAEAERAEALFLVDELRARLDDASDDAVKGLREQLATWEGRALGLSLRLSEAEARAKAAESELEAAREVAIPAALTESERELSTRVGQLTAQLLAARERELDAGVQRDLARAESLALVAETSALATQSRESRDRVVAAIARLLRTQLDDSVGVESGFDRLAELVDGLRGERDGLSLRLAALERASAASASAPTKEASAEFDALRLENQALTADLSEVKEALRVATASSVATRDALVSRLQHELADSERRARSAEESGGRAEAEVARLREALVEASVDVDAHDALLRRVAGLERDLRDAIVAAESAANDAREHRASLERADRDRAYAVEVAERRARAAEEALADTHASFEEMRGILESLRRAADDAPAGEGLGAVSADPLFSERPPAPDDGEKDVLLRALTAQLEERDDQIRALARQLGEAGRTGDADQERSARLGLEETVSRLTDALEVEREARASLERRLHAASATPAPSASVRELEANAARLAEVEALASVHEREVRALREAVADAKRKLEGLVTSDVDPALVARLGDLLTTLGPY